jgi:hypothetical protein
MPHKTWIRPWSSHQRLGLPRCLFPSGFLTNTLYARLFHTCHTTAQFWSVFVMQTRPPVTSSLDKNIFLSALFSNVLGLRSSIWETRLHTRTTQQEKLHFCIYVSLYIWTANCKTRDSAPNNSKHSLTAIFSWLWQEIQRLGRCLRIEPKSCDHTSWRSPRMGGAGRECCLPRPWNAAACCIDVYCITKQQ